MFLYGSKLQYSHIEKLISNPEYGQTFKACCFGHVISNFEIFPSTSIHCKVSQCSCLQHYSHLSQFLQLLYRCYMIQEMRPEIEAINEEMRNVSLLVCLVHILVYMESAQHLFGMLIITFYFIIYVLQSTDPRSMEVGKQKLGELFLRCATFYV